MRVHSHPGSDYQPSQAEGFEEQPTGSDVITDRALIRRHFPYLAENTVALLHARRCGWFSGQQLGMYLLERAREKGVRFIEGRVESIDTSGGRVRAVTVGTRGSEDDRAPSVRECGGPVREARGPAARGGPAVYCERHAKVAFNDVQGAVPRHAPMMIWTDPVRLPWSEDERRELAAHRSTGTCSRNFPPASMDGPRAPARVRSCC